MKWAGILLVIVSLSAGALAAASAYHVPLSLADSYFKDKDGNYLTLKTNAGVVVLTKDTLAKVIQARSLHLQDVADPLNKQALKRLKPEQISNATVDEKSGLVLVDGLPVALAASKTDKKPTELTPALLARLREQSKSLNPRISRRYVVVREFFWAEPPYSWLNLWPYNWLFLLSALGLLGGAVLLRMSAKKEIAAAGDSKFEEGPQAALEGVREILEDLRREVASMEPPQALQTIIQKLDDAQRTHMPAFIDARPQLVARFGMGGYAHLMDSYAACERQINRAWSAAADEVYDEAVECVDAAVELLEETIKKMSSA